ncbi:MAG: histidine phosphatase family protein [Erysipelotrichaceae bacterium]|nr:histidine phosphatase family protein [Erysipelotrichaceae bacterium]
MKKRLYLTRHGQTLMNVEGRAQGRSDSPLTELGIKQAVELHDYLLKEGLLFDSVYTSPLKRAIDSAKLIAGKEAAVIEGLTEMDFGKREGLSHKENIPYRDHFREFGGEDWLDAADRMEKTLTELMEIEGNDSVLAVSHGASCRSFYYKVIDAYDDHFLIPNCSVLIFDYENGHFTFDEIIGPHLDEETRKLSVSIYKKGSR